MAAATVTGRKTGIPGMEIVSGVFTDADTFVTKFGTVIAVMLQSRSRDGAFASVSGRTITLNCASASGDTYDLIVVGRG